MQQSMPQDQIGPPQPQMVQMTPQGQMMYCPVRLVYDHPVLMQQEQIQQPNQNVFVNQPPWARPVQNQVIYVQQVGPGLVQMQQLDPNMYIQQSYQGIPQMIQNVPQGQLRPVLGNVPTNYVQNLVQTVTIDQATGQIIPNYGFIQTSNDANAIVNNPNVNANAVNEDNRQMANNQMSQVPNQEMQTQIYRQVAPQMNTQQNLTRPPVPIVNQMQSMPTMQIMPQQISINPTQMTHTASSMPQINQNMGNVVQMPQNTMNNAPPNVANNVRANVPMNVVQNPPNIVQVPGNNKPNNVVNTGVNTTASLANIANTMRPGIEANMVRNVAQNVAQIRQNVATQSVNNIQNNIRNPTQNVITTVNNANNMNTVLYSAVRNGQPYTYRAIQPKPNNSNTNVNVRVNFSPRPNQPQMVRKPMLHMQSSIVKMDTNQIPAVNKNLPIRPLIQPNNIKTEPELNNMVNRKRKSESPDEIQKKISNYGSITVTSQVKDRIKAKYGQNTSEVGVNTSPVHRPKIKIENQSPMLQINPMEARVKEELVKTVDQVPKSVNMGPENMKVDYVESKTVPSERKEISPQTETQTLVRKTVFPQARGRLLDDKVNVTDKIENIFKSNIENVINTVASLPIAQPYSTQAKAVESAVESGNINVELPNLNDNNINNIVSRDVKEAEKTDCKLEETNEVTKDVQSKDMPILDAIESVTADNKMDDTDTESDRLVIDTDAPEMVLDNQDTEVKKEDKLDSISDTADLVNSMPNDETEIKAKETKLATDFDEVIKDIKIEKKEYKNISVNEISGKEIHIVDGSVEKKERDYILTHVLDGYVIQESNVPFAIRKPLKEKTINTVDEKQDPNMKNLTKDEMKDKILELSQLHLHEGERDRKTKTDENSAEEKDARSEAKLEPVEDEAEKENPFVGLKHSDVKAWTVDEIASHLSKHGWTETVSLLQEHEIDGESLFLVTKSQLTTIGVNESHADVISEFVQRNG